MVNKAIIKENFSKHAREYDQYSKVQNFCASKLINEIGCKQCHNILDLGCGTGNYTKLLRDKFPKSLIKAVDISRAMVEVSKEKLSNQKIEFIIADAEQFKLDNGFDLITSNASFQWFQNLEADLKKYKNALGPGGLLLFSTFGPRTFYQLHSCLEEFLHKPLSISASNFLEKGKIEKLLKTIFSQCEVKEEFYEQTYNSLSGLLESLRCTGTRGDGLRGKIFWTPRTLASIEEIYKKRFSAKGGSASGEKSLVATYQIFFCRGRA